MNQPEYNSKQASKLIAEAAFKYKNLKRWKQLGSSDTALKSVSDGTQVEALSESNFELEQEVAKIEKQVNATMLFATHTNNSNGFTEQWCIQIFEGQTRIYIVGVEWVYFQNLCLQML